MGFDPNEPEQRRRLRDAIYAAGIPVSELWLRYFGIAGDAGEYEVEAYMQGLISLPQLQRDLLAMAANELIDDTPRPHAPYGDEFDGGQAGQAGEAGDDAPRDGERSGAEGDGGMEGADPDGTGDGN